MTNLFDDPRNRQKLVLAGAVGLGLLLIGFLVFIASNSSPRELYIDSAANPVAQQVERLRMDRAYYNKRVQQKTVAFYRITNNKTKWLEFKGPNRNYKTYVKSIKEASQYGLNPDHYDLTQIETEQKLLFENRKRKAEDVAALDVRITASFFLFTTHLIEGRIRNVGYGDHVWERSRVEENDVELLANNSSGDLSEIVGQLHPSHEQYEKLRKALLEHRKMEQSFRIELTSLAANSIIKPGSTHKAVPSIRRMLFITDLDKYDPGADSTHYDERLLKGVQQFQKRHGLVADGIISQTTLKYLNMPFSKKADLIEVNLERLRWLPRELPTDYVWVNVPDYGMKVFENNKPVMEMKVVLGTEFNATPIFSDTLEYIVFSPTWNVPASIFEEEFLPKLREDPSVFNPERFVIYKKDKPINHLKEDWNDKDLKVEEYRMVENPGEINSLGLVKFMLPNEYNIYLHDTPAERLFEKNKRAYSHGCIRLEKPVEFAKYLLRDKDKKWDDERIAEAMQQEEPETVSLEKKYPVHIEYRTVWVDDDGLLNFREDIYDHDKRQIALLNKID